jgi:hypothetical protein
MMSVRFPIVFTFSVFITCMAVAQPVITAEDSLHRENSFLSRSSLGGYGNAFYQNDFNTQEAVVNFERFVLFVGHKFSNRISLFSEIELEDAKLEGGEPGGELALEQAYLKFIINPQLYLATGLFIPRIGMLNENHLPINFNGNERTMVERLIIPATWREMGVGLYGSVNSIPLEYSFALLNGLNSGAFEHGTGIRGGRGGGKEATGNSLAVTGAAVWQPSDFRIQVSGYYGGSVGLAPLQSDSLQLTSGWWGTPVGLAEANVQYEVSGLTLKVLGAVVSIPDAEEINRAYANNTPLFEYGFYAEAAYNILENSKGLSSQQINLFARYEQLNVNASIPANGIDDPTLDQRHVLIGFSYLPIPNVAIKTDVRLLHTGPQNPDLIINPNPAASPYEQNNTFLNVGIGYAF